MAVLFVKQAYTAAVAATCWGYLPVQDTLYVTRVHLCQGASIASARGAGQVLQHAKSKHFRLQQHNFMACSCFTLCTLMCAMMRATSSEHHHKPALLCSVSCLPPYRPEARGSTVGINAQHCHGCAPPPCTTAAARVPCDKCPPTTQRLGITASLVRVLLRSSCALL